MRPQANERQLSLFASCIDPAGESPVPVSAGAPGSRPQAQGEIPVSRAGRQEPLRGSKFRERPLVSRVPEIGMHGLIGGPKEMPANSRVAGN
jgi:hypothetical protein